MSSTTVVKYPLDLTGSAASNLVTNEVHDLSGLSNINNRCFVLNYGPFYTGSLVVTDVATGAVLTPSTVEAQGQYVATQFLSDTTMRTGLEVCTVIVITDATLPVNLQVSCTAQMLGGDYSASVVAIQQMIDALNLGNQPVKWVDILGKPVLFPPAPHLHDIGDIYGFEYLVAALERVTQAIYIGDEAQHQAIYQYINHEVSLLQSAINTENQQLAAHIADHGNPHQVTAAQVGLGNVQNYGVATTDQATAGASTSTYMTPALTAAAINTQALVPLNEHINDHNNPHQVTQTQVGLGNVQNYGIATTTQAQVGTDNASYMTPALVSAAVTTQALAPLNAHLANFSNPHQVTQAQVGLGNVQNYGVASTAQANAGTSTSTYMTPALTASAIASQVGNAFNAHVANFSNPHQVTAAQVGLGNVQNYGIASQNDAINGTGNSSLMTPALTAAAISAQALAPLNNHINNHSNPHAVTQAQVGLGNVQNYGMASNGDATSGNSTTLYMSPATTAAAINSMAVGPLNSHINNHNNPHQVTASQVGLGNVQNYGMANNGDATNGGSTTLYMSPATTAAAINSMAVTPLNNHINNRNNPHGVTASQVGLGNVQNYSMAGNGDATNGGSTTLYMSPATTLAAINNFAVNPLNNHINNTNNPHQVNSSQVGLGNVQNFGVATDDDARAGTRRDVYITPGNLQAALNQMASGQSGSAGNGWFAVIGSTMIQGLYLDFANAWAYVTFPRAFSGAPICVANMRDGGGRSSIACVNGDPSASQVTFWCRSIQSSSKWYDAYGRLFVLAIGPA